MFKVFKGETFVADVYARSVEEVVDFCAFLSNKDQVIRPIARRMWSLGEFEVVQAL